MWCSDVSSKLQWGLETPLFQLHDLEGFAGTESYHIVLIGTKECIQGTILWNFWPQNSNIELHPK